MPASETLPFGRLIVGDGGGPSLPTIKVFICTECSSIVADMEKHDAALHP